MEELNTLTKLGTSKDRQATSSSVGFSTHRNRGTPTSSLPMRSLWSDCSPINTSVSSGNPSSPTTREHSFFERVDHMTIQ